MSIATTPPGCGDAIEIDGVPEYESHSTSIESAPASAVAIHRRSAETQVHEMDAQWPWRRVCRFVFRS